MKLKAPKPRNLVHRAMLQVKRGGAHEKTQKALRNQARMALRRSLKESGFVQRMHSVH